jgi:chemosensory pili system protein ChpE
MLVTAIAGAVMAISFSAPPGPVAVETIRRGVRGGFAPALHVQLGSIIGDVAWCAVALLGLAPLVQVGWVRGLLGATGVVVLLYLGLAGMRDAVSRRPLAAMAEQAAQARFGSAFRSGLAISIANPMAVAWWLSIGGALIAAGVAGTSLTHAAWFVSGFAAGTVAWAFVMAFAIRWGRRLITPTAFRWVTGACAAALMFFGISLAAALLGQT